MKPKLELVNEKSFSTEKVAKHDLDLEHIGKLRLATEVFSDGAIALMYMKRDENAVVPSALGALETLARSLGAALHAKPVLVRVVMLNRFEKLIHVPMRWKAARKLDSMKAYLVSCDKKMGISKEISKQLVGAHKQVN